MSPPFRFSAPYSKACFSILLLLYSSCSIQAYWATDSIVSCHPDYPDICVGLRDWGTPVQSDPANASQYLGAFWWQFQFVEGIEEGKDFWITYGNYSSLEETGLTGLSVQVRLDQDADTCDVEVGNETCSSCRVCNYTGLSLPYIGSVWVSADCENVDGGRQTECELVQHPRRFANDDGGWIYPLQLSKENATDFNSEVTKRPEVALLAPTCAPGSKNKDKDSHKRPKLKQGQRAGTVLAEAAEGWQSQSNVVDNSQWLRSAGGASLSMGSLLLSVHAFLFLITAGFVL